MNIFKKIFTGAADATIGEIGKIADKLSTSADERNEHKVEAMKVLLETQCRIVEAEAKAGGLAATWRPVAALSFVAMIWWWALSGPCGWPPPDLSEVPAEVWMFLMGYGTYREVGKTIQSFNSRRRAKKNG